MDEPQKVELNLASGQEYRDGWINIDNKQMYNGEMMVDIEADVFHLEWKENSVDTILVNHFIQYVTPKWMDILLKRWHGWLKEGGEIYIEAGDIKKVCRRILRAKTTEELHDKNGIMQLYGIDEHIWNKWAWCPQTVDEAMRKAGFTDIIHRNGYFHCNPKRDFLVIGTKTL